jgi:hypothetical protein
MSRNYLDSWQFTLDDRAQCERDDRRLARIAEDRRRSTLAWEALERGPLLPDSTVRTLMAPDSAPDRAWDPTDLPIAVLPGAAGDME